MVCIDTDVAIDLMHGNRRVMAEVERYAEREPATIASITLYELFKGAITEQQLQAVFEFTNRANVYGFQDKEAMEASKIYKRLKKTGTLVKENDILIAGTVIANNELLLTEDSDFERLLSKENLTVL